MHRELRALNNISNKIVKFYFPFTRNVNNQHERISGERNDKIQIVSLEIRNETMESALVGIF